MKDNSKEVSITFRTNKEMKDTLQKMADNDSRSLSNMIQMLLEQAIKNASKKKQ
jgi:hypothetical protein